MPVTLQLEEKGDSAESYVATIECDQSTGKLQVELGLETILPGNLNSSKFIGNVPLASYCY